MERITNWQAPTGRYLKPGTTFKVNGKKGKFTFIAYVVPAKGSAYVEAKDTRAKIRCLFPDEVHTVSNRKGGPDGSDDD